MKTNNQVKRNKRSYIIIALIVVLLLSAVGYAAFQSTLTISGTATANASWDIKFTDCKINGTQDLTKISTTTTTNDTVTVGSLSLAYPGDAKTVEVEITNAGNLDATLTLSCTKTGDTGNKILIKKPTDLDGTSSHNTETLAANTKCTYKYVIQWDPADTTVPSQEITADYTFTFTYDQSSTPSTETPSHGTPHATVTP